MMQTSEEPYNPHNAAASGDPANGTSADGQRGSDVVVMPYTTEQVVAAVHLANQMDVPIAPRGAGTEIANALNPARGGLIINTERMDRLVDVDIDNQRALVHPGVKNAELLQRLAPHGYRFAPDPAFQYASTIGGNIATNSSGPHSLKYGETSSHILAVEIVLHDGRVLWTSDGTRDIAGYDLTALVVGSAGTLGVVTRALVHLVRLPEARRAVLAFLPDVASARAVVAAVLSAGYLPGSLEVMDTNAIRMMNTIYKLDLREAAGALLLIEISGLLDGLDSVLQRIIQVCQQHQALEIRPAYTEAECNQIWTMQQQALGIIRPLAPSYYLIDTPVPYPWLPEMIDQVEAFARSHNIPMGTIIHAGETTMRPMVMYASNDPHSVRHAHELTSTLMQQRIQQQDDLSSQQGIGISYQDFLSLLFSAAELQTMAAIYAVFNPGGRFNPTRIFPAGLDPLQLAAQRHERITSSSGIHSREALGHRLAEVVGEAYVLHDTARTIAYRVGGQVPQWVVQPASLDELSNVLAACHQAGASVVPWGGGTQQLDSPLPHPPDVVLALERLNQVLRYEPESLSLEVGAGATLAHLQALLASHNQMLPIDAPLPDRATIGGLVATASDGPRRPGYGTLRDLLLGMTLVEVDGTIVRNGAQVVKNISGYDLVRLLHGSYGSLAVIASVNLKTLPRPPLETTLLLTFDSLDSLLALRAALATSYLLPVAVEYLDPGAAQRAGLPGTGKFVLALRAEGDAATCERYQRDIEALAARHGCQDVIVVDVESRQSIWAPINELSAASGLDDDEMLLRLAVLPNSLGAALTHLYELTAAHGLQCATHARAMNGIIYARVRGSLHGLHSLQPELVARWQHSRILACHPSAAAGMPLWGALPEGIELMHALKQTFDPAGKLNAGRFMV